MINKSTLYQKVVEIRAIHNEQNTIHDYEKAIDEMWKEFSKETCQQSQGEESADSNKITDKK